MREAPVIDLVSLIEQKSGIGLARRASTGNGEYWGMCPFCKTGENRFHVWPFSSRPHYWCRVCRMSGDAIQFLRDYAQMDFADACRELFLDPDDTASSPAVAAEQAKDGPPNKEWQDSAMLLVERAERYLWHPKSVDGQRALAYLHSRGLTDETIRNAHIGYVPLDSSTGRWHCGQFEDWGFDPEQLTQEQRTKGGVRVPNGILIPWFCDGQIWKLAIKRPGEQMDYGQVMGSGEGMYNIDAVQVGQPTMMVEGEFDALSVIQEAGDLVNCVATGSAKRGRVPRWTLDIALSSCILQSFDSDDAGDDGASFWLNIFDGSILRWSPCLWNDPNEILCDTNGVCTLREWVQYGMESAQVEFAPKQESTLARDTEPVPVIKPEHQQQIDIQSEYERLSFSNRVETPRGPGRIWDMKQLREHIERDRVRIVLDCLTDKRRDRTALFPCKDVEPILLVEMEQLAF